MKDEAREEEEAVESRKPDILERLRETYGDFMLPEEESNAILDENKGNW